MQTSVNNDLVTRSETKMERVIISEKIRDVVSPIHVATSFLDFSVGGGFIRVIAMPATKAASCVQARSTKDSRRDKPRSRCDEQLRR